MVPKEPQNEKTAKLEALRAQNTQPIVLVGQPIVLVVGGALSLDSPGDSAATLRGSIAFAIG